MRRQHLIFNRESIGKLENLKAQYMKLISDREQAAADLQRNSEEDWEDLSEEPLEEEIKRYYLVM